MMHLAASIVVTRCCLQQADMVACLYRICRWSVCHGEIF